ncbi:MAG: O-antigen ligase family protein [Candidatus Kerfeldbacteria bacterium]|nr:O-antigen ligase family protein [Candidatus Kerfeldbacteria bacterium]
MTTTSFKRYGQVFAALAGFELLSWLAFRSSIAQILVTATLTLTAVWLAVRRPTWLVYISIAELVVGSLGHLFEMEFNGVTVSIRMILFVILMLRWSVDRWLRRVNQPQVVKEVSYVVMMVVVLLAASWGYFREQSIGAVWSDANAFLYLLILLPWSTYLRRDPNWTRTVLTILLAGASLVAVKSWVVVMLFGQNIAALPTVYRWIRDTGVGEITFINANIFRVFFQSQIYAVIVFALTFAAWVFGKAPRWWLLPLGLSALGAYISLSRSFWLGIAAALIVIAVWGVRQAGWSAVRRGLVIIPVAVVVWLGMNWALYFPNVVSTGEQRANILLTRLQGSGAASAASARSNQVRPLLAAIAHHPVIGSGFGATVTYYNPDPRINGWRTTSAFELGYLDLWLKLGLVGLAAYGWWLWRTGSRLRTSSWRWWLIAPTAALLVTNTVSPYLNHPLGLGWLMLVALYAYES